MTNTEFLQAMSDLLDEKLEAKLETKLQPIRDDMQDMKDDMQDMKDEMQDMKDEMRGMKDDIHELQRKVAGIGMHIENCTDKNVQLLAENFIELTKKLNMAIPARHCLPSSHMGTPQQNGSYCHNYSKSSHVACPSCHLSCSC